MRLIPDRSGADGERGGAMIIAITVISMLSVLSVAALGRTSNGISSSRQNQDYAGALANADAGVADAIFRVDQRGTGAPTAFCVGAGCPITAVPGAPGVEYRVDVVDRNTVRVRSVGLANGVPHAVEAEFGRQLELPFAIFAKTEASFKGNVDGPSCTQAQMPCQGVYYVNDQHPPQVLTDLDAVVGTTGTVICTGTGSPADQLATFPGGTNSGCPNHVVLSGTYDPKDPISGPCPAPVNTPPTPCRDVTAFTTLTAAQCGDQTGVIAPGRYACATALRFTGTVSVGGGSANGGKVEYFVLPPSGTVDVTLDGASLNIGGDPTKLRINLAGAGKLEGGSGSHAGAITGIVYAPSASATNNGCKIDIRGALVLNDFRCNGAPHLQVQYDSRITGLQQSNWTLANFRELPVRDVQIP